MRRLIVSLLVGSGLFGLALVGSTSASSVSGAWAVNPARDPAAVLRKLGKMSPQSLPLPSVRTLPAAGIHATNVVLAGEINARNGIANFRFQYGRSKKYDTTLEPNEEFVMGSLDHKVAEAVTRLRQEPRTFTTSRPGT
jgi:hypothetical protein